MNKAKDILEGNKLIAEFMGAEMIAPIGHTMRGVKFPKETHGLWVHAASDLHYHTSWDWLMPACKRWDNLWDDKWSVNQIEKYHSLTNELDSFATRYEIEPLWRQLVINIKWYNQNKTS